MEESYFAARSHVLCYGCNTYIFDKYLLKVGDFLWHSECLKCKDCQRTLEGKCYNKGNELYCRTHYLKRFGPKCNSCNERLLENSQTIRVQELIFHDSCIRCTKCARKLCPGDRIYRMEDGNIVCEMDMDSSEADYETVTTKTEDILSSSGNISSISSLDALVKRETFGAETPFGENEAFIESKSDMELNTNYSLGIRNNTIWDDGITEENSDQVVNNNMAESESTFDRDGSLSVEGVDSFEKEGSNEAGADRRRLDQRDEGNSRTSQAKKRGPRTTINKQQMDILEESFRNTPKPSKQDRIKLSTRTDLPLRVIQVWFQNRRSKQRKLNVCNENGRQLGSRVHQPYFPIGSQRFRDAHAPNFSILESGFRNAGYCYQDYIFPERFKERSNSLSSLYYPSRDGRDMMLGNVESYFPSGGLSCSNREGRAPAADNIYGKGSQLEEISLRNIVPCPELYNQRPSNVAMSTLEFES